MDVSCYAYGAQEAFERDGLRWRPAIADELPAVPQGVLVVDSYRLSHEGLERAARSSRMVVMHDHGGVPKGAALVVSPARTVSEGTVARLVGLEHVALRPGFWGLPRRQLRDRVGHVLVTTGSGELYALALEIARAVARALPAARVTLVRGPHASSSGFPENVSLLDVPDCLVDALLFADLAITAGGQTMLEAAAAGTPCIALPLAENQRRQVACLARLGAVRVVDPPSADRSAAAAVELARDKVQRRDLSWRSQQAIDGYGALRLAFQVERLARLP